MARAVTGNLAAGGRARAVLNGMGKIPENKILARYNRAIKVQLQRDMLVTLKWH